MSHKRDIRTGRERILTLSWLGDGQIFMSVVLGIVFVCHVSSQIVLIQNQPILGFCLITILKEKI